MATTEGAPQARETTSPSLEQPQAPSFYTPTPDFCKKIRLVELWAGVATLSAAFMALADVPQWVPLDWALKALAALGLCFINRPHESGFNPQQSRGLGETDTLRHAHKNRISARKVPSTR